MKCSSPTVDPIVVTGKPSSFFIFKKIPTVSVNKEFFKSVKWLNEMIFTSNFKKQIKKCSFKSTFVISILNTLQK